MQVKASVMIAELKVLDRWIENLTWDDLRKPGTGAKLENLVCGCFDLLQYSPTTDARVWQARKSRRQQLDDPRRAARTEEGRQVIRELIELTISDVAACELFQPLVHVGVLPIREPRTLSATHQAALNAGRRRKAENERILLADAISHHLQ